MLLHSANLALAIAGPLGWAWLTVRAWQKGRRLDRMTDHAMQIHRQSRERLDKVNAELVYVRMLRHHHERQASTCHGNVYKGSEAPV